MEGKQAEQMLARFGPLEPLLEDLVKRGKVEDLIALPEPVFNVAMERVRRAHLIRLGYRFMDPSMPGCESCEG